MPSSRTSSRNRDLPDAWSAKRKRQYEHVKESQMDRGEDVDTAAEIAARTVNKQRARSGESKESSDVSTDDISSQRRAAHRRSRGGDGRTYRQLYEEARRRGVPGRSSMNKRQLERALAR